MVAFCFFHAEQIGVKADVLIDREVLVQAKTLRHVAEVMFGAFRVTDDIRARDHHTTLIRRHDSCEHPKGSRLARSIRANEPENFSSMDFKAEMIYRPHSREVLCKPFGDDCGLGVCRHYLRGPVCCCEGALLETNVMCASAGIPGFSS